MPGSKSIFRLDKIQKEFSVKNNDVSVLQNVSFEVFSGDFVIVFGPSGCGKSTLLHVLQGLEKPTLGTVYFYNKDLYGQTEDQRTEKRLEKVGIVQQQPNWIKSLNVVENVAFPLQLKGYAQDYACEIAMKQLQLVDMTAWAQDDPAGLSSGQQQRIAMARALVTNPEVIIADEPTGNLDYASTVSFMQLCKSLNETGTTIIMVTHDLANLAYARKIIQMFDGKIVKVFDQAEGVDLLKDIVAPTHKDIKTGSIFQNYSSKMVVNNTYYNKSNVLHILKKIGYACIFPFIHPIVVLKKIFTSFLDMLKGLYFSIKVLTYLLIKVSGIYAIGNFLYEKLGTKRVQGDKVITDFEFFDLSWRNIAARKARAFVTIGGMTIGISIIVLLLSLGYGLEKLVVDRIALLNEVEQIEVSPAVSSNIKVDDKALESFQNLENVENLYPIINLVGSVEINSSVIDVAVYGVSPDYLNNSANKPVLGKTFNAEGMNLQSSNIFEETVNNEENTAANEKKLLINQPKPGELVVGTGFLENIGIGQAESLDKDVKLTLTVTGNLIDNEQKVVTAPIEYRIVGVVPDQSSNVAYISLQDAKALHISTYSAVRVVASDKSSVAGIRQRIEAMGFKTVSVLDTISQVQNLFETARIFLVTIGIVALIVASLGIFNTLTVSLLERTKEIGLMKLLGMQSGNVQRLFVSEALIMSLIGGITGLIAGYVLGEVISFALSIYTQAEGFGVIRVTYIPLQLILLILLLSILVGIVTGIYPARRATRISALEAIKYE